MLWTAYIYFLFKDELEIENKSRHLCVFSLCASMNSSIKLAKFLFFFLQELLCHSKPDDCHWKVNGFKGQMLFQSTISLYPFFGSLGWWWSPIRVPALCGIHLIKLSS